MPFPRASRALLAVGLDWRVGNHVRKILQDILEESSFAGPRLNPREEGGGCATMHREKQSAGRIIAMKVSTSRGCPLGEVRDVKEKLLHRCWDACS
jgi:hypothetical protein